MTRPAFTLSDLPATALFAAIGCLLGFGLSLIVLLISDGLWMFFLILIPLFILQLIGHGIIHMIIWALACVWAMLRGKPIPKRPPTLPEKASGPRIPQPWIKENIVFIAMTVSFTLIIANAWATGVFTEGFL